MHGETTEEFIKGMYPIGDIGEVSHIARAVVYLEQSPFLTGPAR